MPVASFVRGASGWTLLDHKPQVSARQPEASPRFAPAGEIHALDPEDLTTVCTGEAMVADPNGRSFVPRSAGSCEACNDALDPQAAPTPPDAGPPRT